MKKQDSVISMNNINLIFKGLIILSLAMLITLIVLTNNHSTLQEEYESLEVENDRLVDKVNKLMQEKEDLVNNYVTLTEIDYKLNDIDFVNKKYKVKFIVKPTSVGEDVSVIVDNGKTTVTLTQNNNKYEGIVEFPIRKKVSEIMINTYVDNTLVGDGYYDEFDAYSWVNKAFDCKLVEDSLFIGNDKLTIAGDFKYNIKVNEEIESIQLVCGDSTTDIGVNKKGKVAINESISIKDNDEESMDAICLYIKFVSGVSVKVCPDLYAESMYTIEDEDYAGQTWEDYGYVDVTLPDGEELKY